MPLASRKEVLDIFNDHAIEAWICILKFILDKELLSNAKDLKIIVTPSTGSNHIIKKIAKSWA